MCSFSPSVPSAEYTRDCLRQRDFMRFRIIDDFAYKRWTNARNLKHAKQWLTIMQAVARRAPDYYGYRWRSARLDKHL